MEGVAAHSEIAALLTKDRINFIVAAELEFKNITRSFQFDKNSTRVFKKEE